MEEKLYIESVAIHGPASDFYGYKTLTLMRLPVEEATRKSDLKALIMGAKSQERMSESISQERDIKGPIEAYVVREGRYKLGQVLDEMPKDAVPVNEFFKQE